MSKCFHSNPSVRESVVHMAVDQTNLGPPIGDGEWSDIQATKAKIADAREISPEAEGKLGYTCARPTS